MMHVHMATSSSTAASTDEHQRSGHESGVECLRGVSLPEHVTWWSTTWPSHVTRRRGLGLLRGRHRVATSRESRPRLPAPRSTMSPTICGDWLNIKALLRLLLSIKIICDVCSRLWPAEIAPPMTVSYQRTISTVLLEVMFHLTYK